jgi:hypothetical protein
MCGAIKESLFRKLLEGAVRRLCTVMAITLCTALWTLTELRMNEGWNPELTGLE